MPVGLLEKVYYFRVLNVELAPDMYIVVPSILAEGKAKRTNRKMVEESISRMGSRRKRKRLLSVAK